MLVDNFEYSRDGEAMSIDQFGDTMTTQPTLAWSADAGAIDEYGAFTAPTDGTTACTVSASAASGSNTITGTAAVVVRPRDIDAEQDCLTFDGGYTQDYPNTVAYPSDGVTITCPAPAFLTVAPPRFPGYEGDNFVFAGTRYHCDRGCYTPDGAADMTISFAAARGVESISLVGRLNTCICPAEGGAYKEGTMTVHLANGQTVTTDLVLSASVVPGNYGPFWTGSQYDVSFAQTLTLTQYGPITKIDLNPNRIAFCTVTTDDSTVPDLAAETNDSGQVHLSFSITTNVTNTSEAAKFVGWMFVRPERRYDRPRHGVIGRLLIHAGCRRRRKRRGDAPRLGRREPRPANAVVHPG